MKTLKSCDGIEPAFVYLQRCCQPNKLGTTGWE